MIERKGGDGRNQRPLDNIGRIEPSAEPDLEQAGIGRRAREREDRGRGGDLEKAGFDAAAGVQDLGKQLFQSLVVDQLAGDPDALVEADQVRAGEGVDLVPGRFERGAKEGNRRALAIGPGDVEDRRQPVLRPSEPIEKDADAIETEMVAGGRELVEPIELRLDAGMRRAREVRHQAAAFASGAR